MHHHQHMHDHSYSHNHNIDLVIQGGGMKVVSLLGALDELEHARFRPRHIAGTSAGALVAALSAAGYRAASIRALLERDPATTLFDPPPMARLPVIGPPLTVLRHLGLARGDQLERQVRLALAERGIRQFGDLISPDTAHIPACRHRLQIVVADSTAGRLVVLPRDASRYGIDPDELDVARTVRMSCAIPFLYQPVRLRNRRTGLDHLIVDGGLLSNMPLWIFDQPGLPAWPTLGLRLAQTGPDYPARRGPPLLRRSMTWKLARYCWRLVQTMLQAHDRWHHEVADYARTIDVPAGDAGTLDFDRSLAQIDADFRAGQQATQQFLESWDAELFLRRVRVQRARQRRHPHIAA